MSNKKSILVLTSTFPRWQGDREPPFVFELCKRLSEKFDVIVLAPHTRHARTNDLIDNIEIIRFHYFFPCGEKLAYEGGILANLKQNRFRYFLLPLFLFGQLIALCSLLKKRQIDLIHAHWLIPQGLVVATAGLLMKEIPPVISTSHGGDLLGLNGHVLGKMKRWVISRSQTITVVSQVIFDKALLLGAEPSRLKTIPMGIDTRTVFTPDKSVSRQTHSLLFVGRLVEKKGLAQLLSALPAILSKHPETRLDIIGSGPEELTLKKLAEELGINHAVRFHGAIDNHKIVQWYRTATMLIAPSTVTAQGDQEGLGLVLVEALACECPAIASDLPAIKDVVIDGITGLVYERNNTQDLSNKILYLLQHAELGVKLGQTGRQYVSKNFDWLSITHRYENLINAVIEAEVWKME